MIPKQYIFALMLVIALTVGITWTFNHVNPWLAVLLFFLALFLTNQYFNNENKK